MLKQILSFPYQLVHTLRCALNSKQEKLPRPVISIGNLSFGGTGKTPVTIAIAKYLAESGMKVCILTRGYKSKASSFPLIVSSKDKSLPSVEETGDEALEMLESFKQAGLDVTVAIDPKRFRAGLEALKNQELDVFILDDGMQHINLHRDIEIVLKNVNESGFYREFPWAEKKADYLIHTKVDEDWLGQHNDKHSAVFNLSLNKKLDYKKGIGVFTAIGDSESLVKMIKDLIKKETNNSVIEPIKLMIFPDHHFFSLAEVTHALSLGINIITTSKDLVKIPVEHRGKFHTVSLDLGFLPESFLPELRTKVASSLGGNKDDAGSSG